MDDILGVGSRVIHPAHGEGVIVKLHAAAYDVCFIRFGIKQLGKNYNSWEVVERIPPSEEVTYDKAEKSLIKILRSWAGELERTDIADKWHGGTLILQPEDETLSVKEIPIDDFFHKIVMVRDRLRVMEQRINSSDSLTEAEKVNLQQYLTRIYGSLTTFNVLFREKEDHFVGQRSK